jgi:hypothetical protein
MEKVYTLRNVRTLPGLDGMGVSATIYLDHRRVGTVRDHSDDGMVRFEFDLFTDRIVFEQYVENWWAAAGKDVAFDAVSAEFAHHNPAFVPSLQAKMKYWMKSVINELASAKRARAMA